jgi:hypothetical protein
LKEKVMKRFIAEVTFKGEFPLDMLRHDGAYPETSEDVRKIRESFNPRTRPRGPVTVKIGTAIIGGVAVSAFTVARWNSFGCEVRNIKRG